MIKNKDIDILGKGTYGCALPRIIKCNKTFNPEFLSKPSKLFLNLEDFENEKNNTLFINKHDKGNTSITIFDSCILDKNIINDILEKNNIDKTLLTKCQLENNDIIYQLVFNEMGIVLNHIDNMSFYKLFKHGYNILNGLSLFNSLNFLHLDIKHNNIIYYKPTDKFLIIDFGLSLSYNDFLNSDNINQYTNQSIFNYPPEFIAYDNTLTSSYIYSLFNSYDSSLQKFKKNYESHFINPNMKNFIIKYCYNNDINLYDLALSNLFKKFYDSNNKKNLFKKSIDKIDIYGFGMIYLYLIYNGEHITIKDNEKFIFNIIAKTLLIDPEERISVLELMQLYKDNKII